MTPSERRKPESWLSIVGASEQQPARCRRPHSAGVLCAVTGVSGAGKSSLINGILRPALMRALHEPRSRWAAPQDRGHRSIDNHRHRSAADGRTPRSKPGDVHQGLRLHPRPVRQPARVARLRLQARPLFVQRQRRALRGLRGRWRQSASDALPAGRHGALRGLP